MNNLPPRSSGLSEGAQLSMALDDDGFYKTPALVSLLQQVNHVIHFGDGLSVVTAAKGVGKTTFLHQMSKRLESNSQVCVLSLAEPSEANSLADAIVSGFGLQSQSMISTGEKLVTLRHFVQALTQESKTAFLLIDNADFLYDQAIGALVSLLQGSSHAGVGLRIVFFGSELLSNRIDNLQLIDIPVYDFPLPKFTHEEMTGFLREKLPDVLEEATAQRDENAVEKIAMQSEGIPGEAIALIQALKSDLSAAIESSEPETETTVVSSVPQLLSDEPAAASLEEEGAIEPSKWFAATFLGVPVWHGLALSVLVVVLLFGYLFQALDKPEKNDAPHEVAPALPANLVEAFSEQAVTGAESTGGSINNPENASNTEPSISGDDISLIEQKGVGEIQSLDQSGVADRGEPVEVEAIRPLEIDAPDASQPEKTALLSSTEPLSPDESFLLSLSPRNYVLQIVAVASEASLDAFISQNPSVRLYKYKTLRSGKPWFVAVAGPYASRAQALTARQALPAAMRASGPWPRELEGVQSDIDSVQNSQ